jgi:hypothetical protein
VYVGGKIRYSFGVWSVERVIELPLRLAYTTCGEESQLTMA